jgi:hypothetical protein
MDTKAAEELLNDYLMNGIVTEIFWADQAKAAAVLIGDHSVSINAEGFGEVFGHLQSILSERETMAVAKMYDPPDKRFPTRSIPAMLRLIEQYAGLWSLPQRHMLEHLMIDEGSDPSFVRGMSNQQIASDVAYHFNQTFPQKGKAGSCKLSAALEAVREARNKVLAHNEAIDKAARTLATWGDTKSLVDYAKDFACVIGFGFLGVYLGHGHVDYMLGHDARRFAFNLSQLLDRAQLKKQ